MELILYPCREMKEEGNERGLDQEPWSPTARDHKRCLNGPLGPTDSSSVWYNWKWHCIDIIRQELYLMGKKLFDFWDLQNKCSQNYMTVKFIFIYFFNQFLSAAFFHACYLDWYAKNVQKMPKHVDNLGSVYIWSFRIAALLDALFIWHRSV